MRQTFFTRLWIGAPILVICAGLAPTAPAMACETGLALLRFQDDVACAAEPGGRDSFPGALKLIPLDEAGVATLSLGGEVRQRYEFTNNPGFGADPQDDSGVWMQRLTVHGDLRVGEHVRVFGQLYSALQEGRAGGPSPVDENQLEFQNAFVEVAAPLSFGARQGTAMARVGRQEMQFGSGRLVSVREGPNNRRTFDGARAAVTLDDWRLQGFAARPVDQGQGVFDDQTDDAQWLWGLSATGGRETLPAGAADLYYLGFRDDAGAFVQGSAVEERHSLGARAFGAADGWDWNWEGVFQFGAFGGGDIRAWTVATDTGFTFDAPWRPRLGLSLNIASGDGDPADDDLGTFNPLFPRGNYFSEAAVLGPRNFVNVNPSIQAAPIEGLTTALGANFFWRLNTADGVYTPSGQILRGPGGDERFVGTSLSMSASYEVAPGLTATAIYARLFAGDAISATGPDEDIDFLEFTLQYRF